MAYDHDRERAYRAVVDCYRTARQAWQNEAVQKAARLFGMSERGYCDAYLSNLWQNVTYSSDTTRAPLQLTWEDFDAAYEAAGRKDA